MKDYLPQDELADVLVLAESRFDGRVASFWMGENNDLEILGPGSVYPVDLVDAETEFVLVLGSLALDGGEVVSSGDGYQLLKLER